MECPKCKNKYNFSFLTVWEGNDKEVECSDCDYQGSIEEFSQDENAKKVDKNE